MRTCRLIRPLYRHQYKSASFQTNVNAYKQQQTKAQQPPSAQTNGQASGAKKGGAFDDLLSGFGNIGQKSAEKNRKMGDMKVTYLLTDVI